MEYLASQNFILKDLATRNILMSDNLTIKLSIDLVAQYKDAYAKDYYKFQMKTLPVRWMSPESLLYGRYTQQSDVWSYGVCLWEIFNYGCQPYSGCTNPEAIEMIRDRQLLLIPDECPQRAYALMLECWNEVPMQRPTFSEIVNKLKNWENYYLFNNGNYPLPPPPVAHIQQVPQFAMTNSYSTNSQNSKASSLLGHTVSTGVSNSCSPPPVPPPLHMSSHCQNGVFATTANVNGFYSPSKQMSVQYQQAQTNLFTSKFNSLSGRPSPPSSVVTTSVGAGRIYRDLDPANSLRLSQRNFNPASTFNCNNGNNFYGNGLSHIPGMENFQQSQQQAQHFEL